MLLLTAIFSTIFSGNIANYPVYFLAGRCLFDFFSKTFFKLAAAAKFTSCPFKLSSVLAEPLAHIPTPTANTAITITTAIIFFETTIHHLLK